jgi:peptidoglycan/LPS O-acetylase OafA/YrhL
VRRDGIPELDGLRGLAALIVLVSHVSNDSGLWGGLLGHGGGQTGVMLFFVLSGFLMAHIHIETEFLARNVWDYAVRRVARVFPMFVLVAAAFQLQPWIVAWVWPGRDVWVTILRQVTLIDPGFSILWTVRVEILFYVAFVGIWFLHRRMARRWVTLCVLGSAVLVLSTTWVGEWGVFLATCRYFLFGIMSALLMPRVPLRAGAAVSVLSLAVLASVPLSFPLMARHFFGVEVDPWRSDVVAVQVVLLFNVVVRLRSWLSAALATWVAREIGRISYSLYLLQPFVLTAVVVRIAPGRPLVTLAIILVCAIVVAELSNRLIERPAQRLLLRAGPDMRLPVGNRSVPGPSRL